MAIRSYPSGPGKLIQEHFDSLSEAERVAIRLRYGGLEEWFKEEVVPLIRKYRDEARQEQENRNESSDSHA
jgi:hypothetical protein